MQYTELLISTSLCIIEQANIPPLFSILYVPRLLKQPILQILLKLDLCKYKLFLCKGGSNLFQSFETDTLMAGTKFSNFLGLKHYKKVKKIKHFIHLGLAQGPQSFATYR